MPTGLWSKNISRGIHIGGWDWKRCGNGRRPVFRLLQSSFTGIGHGSAVIVRSGMEKDSGALEGVGGAVAQGSNCGF